MAKYGKSLQNMHEHEWTYHELLLISLKPPQVKIWPSKKNTIIYKGPQKKKAIIITIMMMFQFQSKFLEQAT